MALTLPLGTQQLTNLKTGSAFKTQTRLKRDFLSRFSHLLTPPVRASLSTLFSMTTTKKTHGRQITPLLYQLLNFKPKLLRLIQIRTKATFNKVQKRIPPL